MSFPPLTALRAFEAAIRHGRMTRAAEELGVTHGAISRQVRLLEDSFGTQLMTRSPSGLVPTETGVALAQHLSRGFREIEAGVAMLRADAGGVLDVSCLGTFTLRWLIPRLGRFATAHPGLEVRLSQSDAPCDFSRGRYDVAIRVTDHDLPAGTHVTTLFAERFGPVLAPALAARLALRSPADLIRAPRLWARTRPGAWADWGARSGCAVHEGGTAYEHFYFLLEAAAAGLGAAIAPEPHVADDLAAGRLVAPFGFLPSGLSYVAVRRLDAPRKARAFCDWIGREAAG
ncbi:LysR substrate-binding domain-containing protein [Rhodobacter maris]|uniref:LysR substrate-binding domain-containing protein n=1 Tax=Rhodobacter maris TaxID=446682 RepID=UPI001FE4C145|nr:LysR substrate-binding domain-containing protein [Rhodobacter maris]